jgi:hypothetical protein
MKKITFYNLAVTLLISVCSFGYQAQSDVPQQPAVQQAAETDKKIETRAPGKARRIKRSLPVAQKIETSAPANWVNQKEDYDRMKVLARALGTGVYSVGVIPLNKADCPNETLVAIDMEDEDGDNRNLVSGWPGAITNERQSNHTVFYFCKVDGSSFKPLFSQGPQDIRPYALLKLGVACPLGAVEFRRYFDNEDDDNENGRLNQGNTYPNWTGTNTELQFCLFTYGNRTMQDFPDLKDKNGKPLKYGVFADAFPEAMALGRMHIDDEDHDNRNKYSVPSNVKDIAQRIISDGKNTDIRLARVK